MVICFVFLFGKNKSGVDGGVVADDPYGWDEFLLSMGVAVLSLGSVEVETSRLVALRGIMGICVW